MNPVIHTLENAGLTLTPGVAPWPGVTYHEQPCWSRTLLTKLTRPDVCKATLDALHAGTYTREPETDSQILGTVFEHVLMGREVPDTYYIASGKEHTPDGKTRVKADAWATIQAMYQGAHSEGWVDAFQQMERQVVLYMNVTHSAYPDTCIVVKGELDARKAATRTIYDVKTCTDATWPEFGAQMKRNNYPLQGATYLALDYANGGECESFTLLCCETKVTPETGLHFVNPLEMNWRTPQLNDAATELAGLLTEAIRRTAENDWRITPRGVPTVITGYR